MSTPYLGEIRMFAGNFPPVGWLFCQGQLLAISEYDAFFALIGTTYGGDGEETFRLPDLSSRIAVGRSSTRPLGAAAGVESVTLTPQQLPTHSHPAQASSSAASSTSPVGQVWAASGSTPFTADAPREGMSPAAVAPTGGSQPHQNLPPYLAVNYIIAVTGIYPSQG